MWRSIQRAGTMTSLSAILWLSGCGGGGSGGDPAPPQMLEGDDAVEATVRVVQSTIALLVALRTEESTFRSVGGTCSGGSATASCDVRNAESVVNASFDQCLVPLNDGSVLTADGRLRLATTDRSTCVSGRIDSSARLDVEYRDFVQVLTSAGGTELSRAHADGTDRITPTGVGCGGRNLIDEINATIDMTVAARLPARLLADGIDAEIVTQGLSLNQTSAGTPCERSMVVDGDLEVDDRANGIRYSQTLNGVTLSYIEANDTAQVEINGNLDNDCVGFLSLTTIEPLHLRNATDCPTGGILSIATQSRTSEVRFDAQGAVSIDYNSDGQFELVASNCDLPAQCTR